MMILKSVTATTPISLTPVLSKVLEGFVLSWLCPIVMPHIDSHLFGGIKDSSTSHALVRLIHEWLQAAETPKAVVRSCLIGFSKAFNRIDHNILIYKLKCSAYRIELVCEISSRPVPACLSMPGYHRGPSLAPCSSWS